MSSEVYIVGAARTPVGSFQGALANQKAPELGAHAIAAALGQAGVDATEIDEVIMGNVVSAGLKQAPARQAMRQAELPDSCGATTINKVCGSGMKATMLATDLIRAGSAATVVAGGDWDGNRCQPTLLTDVTEEMTVCRTETFGPVTSIYPVESYEEGLERANDTEYGLSSAIFTKDIDKAFHFARHIGAGMCHINGPTIHDEAHVPFGGNGESGGCGGGGGEGSLTELNW